MFNLSHRHYEKRLSLHNTECYIPHMLVYLCICYFYLAVLLYAYCGSVDVYSWREDETCDLEEINSVDRLLGILNWFV